MSTRAKTNLLPHGRSYDGIFEGFVGPTRPERHLSIEHGFGGETVEAKSHCT